MWMGSVGHLFGPPLRKGQKGRRPARRPSMGGEKDEAVTAPLSDLLLFALQSQKFASAPMTRPHLAVAQPTANTTTKTLTYLDGMDPFTTRVHGLRVLSIARRPHPRRVRS
ncbi:hypothetical protein FB451DRAFT_1560710, partial [Mycena latifolia]